MKSKGKRILIVDDDLSIQRILRKNLQVNNYDVLVAENGQQAVEMTQLNQPDLILLDLWLPGEIDGMIVCQRVREWNKKIPIIILSARNEEKQKVQALDLGADDYLTKPFSNEELLARVRACLRRAEDAGDQDGLVPKPEVLISEDGYLAMNVVRRQVRAGEQDVKL